MNSKTSQKLSGYAAGLFLILLISACSIHHASVMRSSEGMDEDIEARTRWETQMLADPATGAIPDHIRAKELAFSATLPKQPEPMTKTGSFWQNRGPWNVGGRTRALALDVTNENIILAASVSGGIYRSTDGGASWNKITGQSQDLDISCLVQDTRKGKTNIWYAGTGELNGNSASAGNFSSFFWGDGILKSTDGGQHFFKLPSTSSGLPQVYRPFDIVNNIAIDEADTGDIIYAAMGASSGNIYKSMDGGNSWKVIKGTGLNPYAEYTDVAVSPKGVLYFTRSNNGNEGGIYRSVDGVNMVNITPPGFAGTYDLVTIGIDPNDENTVYFLGYTPGSGYKETDYRGVTDYASLWKYRYISGNGTGSGGAWKDLSKNMPNFGGDFGNFNTQTGYNLYVKVKPGDSKTVFLGCTNLWRSTDSFSTSNNISWIGGYGVNTARPDYKLYPNQHPDQHNLVFYPSNPNKMITSCDGGVFRTDDNSAANVTYNSLNNGYLTTQFYTIAIDHGTAGNNEIIGGLQDNGSFMTNSSNPQKSWSMPGNGDGCFCAIADGRTDYYVSSQLGHVYREILDTSGTPLQKARVDPLGAKGQMFVDPFILDPNDQKRMFYVAGNHLYRNNDVTQIPLHNTTDTNAVLTGWQILNLGKDSNLTISALAMSHGNTERLVYGTINGNVFRIDGADGVSPTVTNITGSTFPNGGYVSSIAINPLNPNNMIVVFSNYNVISLYYTTNGGNTWIDIAANLEQNTNGSGNGPSCRWASIMPVGHHFAYFVGTSTGLYGTDTLKGAKTIWAQQNPEGIGNDIVTMIDTRPSDGLVAVATHGNGIFTANISFAYQVSGIDENADESNAFQKLNCYPNPVASGSTLNIEYNNETAGQHALISIVDEEGRLISETPVSGNNASGKQTVPVKLPELKSGIYYVRIQNGNNSVARTFVVR